MVQRVALAWTRPSRAAGVGTVSDRLRFRKRQRLHGRADFARILRRRCSVADDVLVVYVDAPGAAWPRIGVRTGKRLGRAVARNRARRRLKEAFRLHQRELPILDVVCQVRNVDAQVEEFARSLRKLVTAAQKRLERVQRQSAAPATRSRPGSR
jgi:ribonuclease P protein component